MKHLTRRNCCTLENGPSQLQVVPTLFGVFGDRTIVTIGALDLGHIIWTTLMMYFALYFIPGQQMLRLEGAW